eukprot:c17861_g1_i1 orf=1-381(-)
MARAACFPKAVTTPATNLCGDSGFAHISSRSCLWAFPAISRKWVLALRTDNRMQSIYKRRNHHRLAPLCNAESQDESSSSGLGSAVEERPVVDLQNDEDDSADPAPENLSSWLYPANEELPDDVEMS